MAASSYMAGSLVRTIATFTDINGALANPDTVDLKYQIGSGSVETPTPVNDSTGVFHYDIDTTGATTSGNVSVVLEWIGTGAVQAINSDTFTVTPAPL
jgi:hypothetical protein